jgi:hypothetical protein
MTRNLNFILEWYKEICIMQWRTRGQTPTSPKLLLFLGCLELLLNFWCVSPISLPRERIMKTGPRMVASLHSYIVACLSVWRIWIGVCSSYDDFGFFFFFLVPWTRHRESRTSPIPSLLPSPRRKWHQCCLSFLRYETKCVEQTSFRQSLCRYVPAQLVLT